MALSFSCYCMPWHPSSPALPSLSATHTHSVHVQIMAQKSNQGLSGPALTGPIGNYCNLPPTLSLNMPCIYTFPVLLCQHQEVNLWSSATASPSTTAHAARGGFSSLGQH